MQAQNYPTTYVPKTPLCPICPRATIRRQCLENQHVTSCLFCGTSYTSRSRACPECDKTAPLLKHEWNHTLAMDWLKVEETQYTGFDLGACLLAIIGSNIDEEKRLLIEQSRQNEDIEAEWRRDLITKASQLCNAEDHEIQEAILVLRDTDANADQQRIENAIGTIKGYEKRAQPAIMAAVEALRMLRESQRLILYRAARRAIGLE